MLILSVNVNDDSTAKVSISLAECNIGEFENDLSEMMIKDGKEAAQIERADVESIVQRYTQNYITIERQPSWADVLQSTFWLSHIPNSLA